MSRLAALLFAWALVLFAAPVRGDAFEHGLLWEVSRPGGPASHVFGTMHVADPRLLALPPAAARAFSAARTFILEMYPDEAVAQRFSEAGRLEGGMRLSALLAREPFESLAGRLATRGMARERVDQLKPWAALLIATAAHGTDDEPLDLALYVQARFANKRIEELDSVEEQIAVFDDLPQATQLALLELALARHEALHAELEESIRAYLRGDLAALMALSRRNDGGTPAGAAHQALLEKRIIHDRSVVMAYRAQPHLRRGGAFIAVGALHLYGDKGILALLREDGWRVRRVR